MKQVRKTAAYEELKVMRVEDFVSFERFCTIPGSNDIHFDMAGDTERN